MKKTILNYLSFAALFSFLSLTFFKIPFGYIACAILLVLAFNKMTNPLNKKYTIIALILITVSTLITIFNPIIFKQAELNINNSEISVQQLFDELSVYLSQSLIPTIISGVASLIRIAAVIFISRNFNLFADDRVFNGTHVNANEITKITKKYVITSIITEIIAVALLFITGFFIKYIQIGESGEIIVDPNSPATFLSIPIVILSICILVAAIMSLVYLIKLLIRMFNFKAAFNNVGDENNQDNESLDNEEQEDN